jgi:lipid-binding SYLF domain-containing protein
MKIIGILGLAVVLGMSPLPASAQVGAPASGSFPANGYDTSLASKIQSCDLVLEQFLAGEGLPSELVKDAKAVVIFSNAVRAGFIFSGQYGHGVALFRDDAGEWSAPAFFRISGMGVGFQAGGEVADHILVIRTQAGLDALLREHFTLGMDVDATAGPVGRNLDIATNTQTDILTYGRTRGLYAGVSLDGAVIKQDAAANERYYGEPLDARQILMERGGYITEPASGLIETLNQEADAHGSM